eukprot:gnl/Carplike_NY0171/4726_a6431_239.p1 GENE.gnl/Carplike_NY0171/4726_a6431_239~~gnl/Carplike_NY0171/4726_a6431_239.p1  ORF type:complete len:628 (+),score=145.24 gnl/Carplike_NY0171/4726_a6431_239:25-1908(+)
MMHARMTLGRSRPSKKEILAKDTERFPKLEDFLEKRDFLGAYTLLRFCANFIRNLKSRGIDVEDVDPSLEELRDPFILKLWVGYCLFHLGKYQDAERIYTNLLEEVEEKSMDSSRFDDSESDTFHNHAFTQKLHLYRCICYFYLGMYDKAEEGLSLCPVCSLRTRLEFHLAAKMKGDAAEERLMGLHKSLEDVMEDHLTLASVHYLRSHYDEAVKTYDSVIKRFCADHTTRASKSEEKESLIVPTKEFAALLLYKAMCFYRLEFFDQCEEQLELFQEITGGAQSLTTIMLMACNDYRSSESSNAVASVKDFVKRHSHMATHPMIVHNLCIFKDAEDADSILPGLLDSIPEARMNLALFYLNAGDTKEAWEVMKDFEPGDPQQYVLRGIVAASHGQASGSDDLVELAKDDFKLVGESPDDKDTILGRQSMASYLFLEGNYSLSVRYLESIGEYLDDDESYAWNIGMAYAVLEDYGKAVNAFELLPEDHPYRSDFLFRAWYAKSLIRDGNPVKAWGVYLNAGSADERLVQLIANECYSCGHYLYACKAFDVLDKIMPGKENWEGKRGAAIGVLKMYSDGTVDIAAIRAVLKMIWQSEHEQKEFIFSSILQWCQTNTDGISEDEIKRIKR